MLGGILYDKENLRYSSINMKMRSFCYVERSCDYNIICRVKLIEVVLALEKARL